MNTEIIITNVLPTGTGFAVVASNTQESVFVPSKIMSASGLDVGDRVNALLVPNHTQLNKTPWIALKLSDSEIVDAANDLADFILTDLKQGRANVEEIADSIGVAKHLVASQLANLLASGRVSQSVCYDLVGDDQ